MKIYITGVSGRLGKAVFRRLENAILLVRTPLKNGERTGNKTEMELTQIVTDFSEDELRPILKDAEIIVHIAGSLDMLDKKKLQEGNVELTRNIVNAAPKNCRIIYAGSISVYGKNLVELPANEKTTVKPDSDYARTKYEAERLVMTRPNALTFRIGALYGNDFLDYFTIFELIERGKMAIIGEGNNNVPFVHVDDVAEVIARSATNKKIHGIYLVSGDPITQKEAFGIAFKELGKTMPSKTISRSKALFFATLEEIKYKILGTKPRLTTEHINILTANRLFDCSKAKKELGFSPRHLADGIKEMVRVYRSKRGRQSSDRIG